MPTIITKTIKPGGIGDYLTVKDAIAHTALIKDRNLVTNDEQVILEVYSGVAETAVIAIADWGTVVTDPTRNIIIRAAAGHRHIGIWDAAKPTITAAVTYAHGVIDVPGAVHVTFQYWQISVSSGHSSRPSAFRLDSGGSTTNTVTIDSCIMRCTGAKTSPDSGGALSLYGSTAQNVTFINNIVCDFPKHIWQATSSSAAGTRIIENNTFVGNSQSGGVDLNSASTSSYVLKFKNNIMQGVGTQYRVQSSVSRSELTNLSNDASTGVSIQNTTLTFVNAAGSHYALAPGVDTAATGVGTNLYADATLAITLDGTGLSRPSAGAWDLGAMKVVVASQVAITTAPAGAYSGIALLTQPRVELRSSGGDLVMASSASVTASVFSGSGVLTGTVTLAAVGGVVQFTDLIVTGAGPVVLRFASGALTPADTGSLSITPVPNELTLATPPTAISVSNIVLPVQPVINIRAIAGGALQTGATDDVTVSVASGSVVLGGTTTVTAVGGVATFTDLVFDRYSILTDKPSVVLRFTALGINSVVTSTLTVALVEPPVQWSTARPDMTGALVVPIANAAALTAALTNLKNGTGGLTDAQPIILALTPGVVYPGSFLLPERPSMNNWVELTTNLTQPMIDAVCPEGTRMTPAKAAALKLATVRLNTTVSAIGVDYGGKKYRISLLTVDSPGQWHTGLIITGFLGDASPLPGLHDPTKATHNITVDRCYVKGDKTVSQSRGVQMVGRWVAVQDSHVEDFYDGGSDSQAVAGYGCEGPYKIENNFLDGWSEVIMFGGTHSKMTDIHGVPCDITIRRNVLTKKVALYGTNALYAREKNAIEMKDGRRILIEDNIIEHTQVADQTGAALLLKSTNQTGIHTLAGVQDAEVRNNMFRLVGNGISLLARDGASVNCNPLNRVHFHDNLIVDLNYVSPYLGEASNYAVFSDVAKITVEHNTTVRMSGATAKAVYYDGAHAAIGSVRFRSNIIGYGYYGMWRDGGLFHYNTGSWPVSGSGLDYNLFVGTPGGTNPTGVSPPPGTHTLTVASDAAVGFVDLAGANYALAASTPGQGTAHDLLDRGIIDYAAFLLALQGVDYSPSDWFIPARTRMARAGRRWF